jgi:hypothetical protein
MWSIKGTEIRTIGYGFNRKIETTLDHVVLQ